MAAASVVLAEWAWYGMLEFYVRDPDGYVICVAPRDEARNA